MAKEALQAARENGTVASYDLNYRESLWKAIGGRKRAIEVNREVVSQVDVLFGNEEDFTAALGFEVEGVDENLSKLDPESFRRMIERVVAAYPESEAGGHHPAQCQERDLQRLGSRLLLPGAALFAPRYAMIWKSTIGWAAVTRSLPG